MQTISTGLTRLSCVSWSCILLLVWADPCFRPVLVVTRTCWKQGSEGNVLNFHFLRGKSTWVAAVSEFGVLCEVDVNELQPGVQRSARAKEHHLSAEEFGQGALWLEAARSPDQTALHTNKTAQPVVSWGYPKSYLALEIRVLLEIGDFSTFTSSSGGEFMKN